MRSPRDGDAAADGDVLLAGVTLIHVAQTILLLLSAHHLIFVFSISLPLVLPPPALPTSPDPNPLRPLRPNVSHRSNRPFSAFRSKSAVIANRSTKEPTKPIRQTLKGSFTCVYCGVNPTVRRRGVNNILPELSSFAPSWTADSPHHPPRHNRRFRDQLDA